MARQASSGVDPAAPASHRVAASGGARRIRPPVAGATAATILTVLMSAATTPNARAGDTLASVLGASGEALVIRPAGPALPPHAGMSLGAGDRLLTRSDGRVSMRLDDGTLIALHPNTEMTLDAKALQAEAPRGLLVLMRAALRTVSEGLGRRAPGESRPPAAAGATIGRRTPAPVPVPRVPDPVAGSGACPAEGCTPGTVRLAAGPSRADPPPR
jgi:hypothetical protein